MKENIYRPLGVSDELFKKSEEILEQLAGRFRDLDELQEKNQLRVLQAFLHAGVTQGSLVGTTGYGYDDQGRDALEQIFAELFESEAALVRHQFSSGTQVLTCCLRGLLRPGDELLIATGEVYDSLQGTLGRAGDPEDLGSLRDFGISIRQLDLDSEGKLKTEEILQALNAKTKLLYFQKSRGYSSRRTLLNAEIGEALRLAKAKKPGLLVMVDNCYGELTEEHEPSFYGADIAAGSLIKNLGAGIADSGAYVCGTEEAVRKVACQMSSPGLAGEIGPGLGQLRNLFRGLYFAPQVTNTALKSALHAAALFAAEGYKVTPDSQQLRGDIVQLIELGSREKLCAFCEEIQSASPVDARFTPVPAPMPGYDCDIIMASGSFVQGSSIECSCDGPLRPPYRAYLQGGLSFAQSRLAQLRAAERLRSMESA